MSGLFSDREFAGDFLAEVGAIDGRIGVANFARVLARCAGDAPTAPACALNACG
jgi:hypothetical protein